MKKICVLIVFLLANTLLFFSPILLLGKDPVELGQSGSAYERYINFFEEIYAAMDENYYHPLDRADYDRFIHQFNREIFAKLDQSDQWNDFINLRSGALLVDFLKKPEDSFSALLPPQIAKEFQQEVLGKRIDLGIEGEKIDEGFKVLRIEPRADAFLKGLRLNDLIIAINDNKIKDLTQGQITELLAPKEGETVLIEFIESASFLSKAIEVLSQEYFHQTVFPVSVPVPNIFCLRIERFNRLTAEEMVNYLALINQQGRSGLILDLRSNPGGPPLAARELASFFLTPNQIFMYFSHRDDQRSYLDVPEIPEQFRYTGPVVILVDQESGSAAEIFSGIMQRQGRASLIGSNTAGQVFLKSMFTLENESMLALITARGHHPDGEIFSFNGVIPSYPINQRDVDLVSFAAGYMFYQMHIQRGSP